MKSKLLKSPLYIKLNSLNDLARLTCSLERIPIPIFEYVYNDENIFATISDIFDSRHIIYYVDNVTSGNNNFISYKIMNNYEEIILVDSAKDTSALYSPIIKITNMPKSFLNPTKVGNRCKYVSIRLKNLLSLSNLIAFRTIYEEFSLPLFLFPNSNSSSEYILSKEQEIQYVLGTTVNLDDTNENAYFYYVLIDYEIKNYFLKFSIQTSNEPSFSNHLDGHGFTYLKIIRLDDVHPLVSLK